MDFMSSFASFLASLLISFSLADFSSFLFFLVQQSADTGVHLALSELLQQRVDGFIHT
jgi:hypothetical protein